MLITRNQIIAFAKTLADLGSRIANTLAIPRLQWISSGIVWWKELVAAPDVLYPTPSLSFLNRAAHLRAFPVAAFLLNRALRLFFELLRTRVLQYLAGLIVPRKLRTQDQFAVKNGEQWVSP